MNWKELYALVNENIKNAVSGLYKPAGDVTFAELPELSQSVLGYTYTVTDAFTTDSRFTDYDTETQAGHSFPADTEVAVIVTGTTENPVYMFNVMGGIMDGYATKGDLDNYVEKESGKSLSTNDYTNADKALVQNSPITTTATGSDLTLSTSSGNLNALTVYGKSEVVDGSIKSAGDGGSIEVETCGKNLIDITKSADVVRPDGVTRNGLSFFGLNGIYTLSQGSGSSVFYYGVWDGNQWSETGTIQPNTSETISLNATKSLWLWVAENHQMSQLITTAQLEVGSTATAYEPYNGTMATFTTGTPLRGIPDTARDVMRWDGSAGTVAKNCGDVLATTLLWQKANRNKDDTGFIYYAYLGASSYMKAFKHFILPNYTSIIYDSSGWETIAVNTGFIIPSYIVICSTSNDTTELATELANKHIVYELATPTTEQLTPTENNSIAGLRTFTSQTHAQNNAGAEMTVEAYAGTANGRAVNELKQDVQSEISALKITQSATLTLTVADWSSNQQTVTYAHDTAKRNVIDVDPASVEEWASCGVLATAETATSITFTCKTVPENALTFRVTSMGVN